MLLFTEVQNWRREKREERHNEAEQYLYVFWSKVEMTIQGRSMWCGQGACENTCGWAGEMWGRLGRCGRERIEAEAEGVWQSGGSGSPRAKSGRQSVRVFVWSYVF